MSNKYVIETNYHTSVRIKFEIKQRIHNYVDRITDVLFPFGFYIIKLLFFFNSLLFN